MESPEGSQDLENLIVPEVWNECCIEIKTPVAPEDQIVSQKKTLTTKTRVPYGQFKSIESLKLYIKTIAKNSPNAKIEVTFT